MLALAIFPASVCVCVREREREKERERDSSRFLDTHRPEGGPLLLRRRLEGYLAFEEASPRRTLQEYLSIKKRHSVGPYSKTMPRLLWRS